MKLKQTRTFKAISLSVVFSLLFNMPFPHSSFAQNLQLPPANQFINLSPAYSFPILKGLKFDPANPLKMEFIIDTADKKDISQEEAAMLIKYFLAGLTIAEGDIWVNLSPYEQNRIIPETLSQTDLGKDLLSQDYLLKQLMASLTYPESDSGKDFWSKTYAEVLKIAQTTNLPVNTFNKVWIVPEEAEVYENANTGFITRATLKVMLEEDYLALKNRLEDIKKEKKAMDNVLIEKINQASSGVMKETVLPKITQEINSGKNFAQLRQIYHSLILGMWFKKKFKDSLYQYYIDQGKIKGIDLEDKTVKEKIYQQYVQAFKSGLYNYIRADYDPPSRKNIKRRYYSGGFSLQTENGSFPLKVKTELPPGGSPETSFSGSPKIVTAEVIPNRDSGAQSGSPLIGNSLYDEGGLLNKEEGRKIRKWLLEAVKKSFGLRNIEEYSYYDKGEKKSRKVIKIGEGLSAIIPEELLVLFKKKGITTVQNRVPEGTPPALVNVGWAVVGTSSKTGDDIFFVGTYNMLEDDILDGRNPEAVKNGKKAISENIEEMIKEGLQAEAQKVLELIIGKIEKQIKDLEELIKSKEGDFSIATDTPKHIKSLGMIKGDFEKMLLPLTPPSVSPGPAASIPVGKLVYFFSEKESEGVSLIEEKARKILLGGKGLGMQKMSAMGISVPPGFTIISTAGNQFLKQGSYPEGLKEEIESNLARLEALRGKKLGDPDDPLLVSVRSGAQSSMPGMMDTVLNLGLTPSSVTGLARETNNPRFAYDAYRRFIEGFGKIVLGIEKADEKFLEIFNHIKQDEGIEVNPATDSEVSAQALKNKVIPRYMELVRKETSQEFPSDPKIQLDLAIKAVFNSWNSQRAKDYREVHNIPADWGTACSIVAMVFGNTGVTSGTGVYFTRDNTTGESRPYGDFLINAQGDDVVSGKYPTLKINELENKFPEIYRQLLEIGKKLENEEKEMQDIEFTIQDGKLYILQKRTGKRTGQAAIKIAVDMAKEGLITKEDAILRVSSLDLAQLLYPRLDPQAKVETIAKGAAGSLGVASGKIVFDTESVLAYKKRGEKVILVRIETSPEDFKGMVKADGILTARGGETSHAAIVCKSERKIGVFGAGDLVIDYAAKMIKIGNRELKEGDIITVDANARKVYLGEVPLIPGGLTEEAKELLSWADGIRRLGVRANADTPEQAEKAKEFGAKGIGLLRIEHWIQVNEELQELFQLWILADDPEIKKEALSKIEPLLKKDMKEVLKIMQGYPVIVRTIDPPLHEFLPKDKDKIQALADKLKRGIKPSQSAKDIGLISKMRSWMLKIGLLTDPYVEQIEKKIESLKEFNPMLGHRGARLGITDPDITAMQARAIIGAGCELVKEGIKAIPEIMIPVVAVDKELKHQEEIVRQTADEVMKSYGVSREELPWKFGTMIELPSAALSAGELAKIADFFSFGTNDLTQTTLGLSRDDTGNLLDWYVSQGVLSVNPFVTLHPKVSQLMAKTVWEAKAVKGDLEIGICGEHGRDPESIEISDKIGLDYVSPSGDGILIARLVAAQSELKLRAERSKITAVTFKEAYAELVKIIDAHRQGKEVLIPEFINFKQKFTFEPDKNKPDGLLIENILPILLREMMLEKDVLSDPATPIIQVNRLPDGRLQLKQIIPQPIFYMDGSAGASSSTISYSLEPRIAYDSRGKHTVEVTLRVGDLEVTGDVPAGASKGEDEAKTVNIEQAIKNIKEIILPLLQQSGLDLRKHQDLIAMEKLLIEKAGDNFSRLGANATVPVSRALWKMAAKLQGMELWEYIRKYEPEAVADNPKIAYHLMNIFNGGLHALKNGETLGNDRIAIQEIMVVPVGAKSQEEALKMGDRIDYHLQMMLLNPYIVEQITRADEAGFSVQGLGDSDKAIEYVFAAIKKAGYEPGRDVKLSLDVAATSFFNKETGRYSFQGKELTSDEMIAYYVNLAEKYQGKIFSIEDGLAENDWEGWQKMTQEMEKHGIRTVGDDLFVTQLGRLEKGIKREAATDILIKVNQNGTMSGTLEVIKRAKEAKMGWIVSHRSGETLDTSIADLAYATKALGLKAGDPQPDYDFGEGGPYQKQLLVRRVKYLRMVEIEERESPLASSSPIKTIDALPGAWATGENPGGIDMQGINIDAAPSSSAVNMAMPFGPCDFAGFSFRIIRMEELKDLKAVFSG